ncbi:hypothetical protein AgCh_007651 [Apium graveolens]
MEYGTGGCTYFLQVFSLQKLKPFTTEMPVISAWNKKETKNAMKKIKKEMSSVEGAACVSVNQRLERLEGLVRIERWARLENITSETQQRLTRLENIILRQNMSRSEKIDVEKYVSPDMDDDEPTIRAIMKSLQVGAHVHSDVLYFYVRFLKRLWAKTNKPFSEIPNVITRKVESPVSPVWERQNSPKAPPSLSSVPKKENTSEASAREDIELEHGDIHD